MPMRLSYKVVYGNCMEHCSEKNHVSLFLSPGRIIL